jgi:PAS domain S-box-containing protein
MVLRKDITSLIKDILKKNPQGLSITDIVGATGINRNTVGRYLENLLVSGQAEMRRFGMAKIYVHSQRVPLSAVLSISSELVVQLDNNLRIVFTNQPFLNLIGSEEREILGKNIEYTPVSTVFDVSFTMLIEHIREGIAGREWSGEITLPTIDIILFCRIAPTVFDDGRKGVSVIIEDITQRKQAEQKVEESEIQFRLLAENSLDMIGRIKPDFTHEYASPAYTTTLGFQPEEVTGKEARLFIHPDDVHVVESVRNILTPWNSSETIRFRVKHKNGHYIWVESHVRAIFDEKRQELSEYYAVTRDITERKLAEEKLLESEDRYRKLVEISPEAVFLHREGRILYANPAAFRLLGASYSDELIGKNVLDFIQPEYREAVRKNIEKDLEGQTTPNTELHMSRLDGTSIIVEGKGVKTNIDGKPAIQVAIRDITMQKRTEENLKKSEEMYRSLVETTGTGYVILDKAGRVISANQEYIRLTGRSSLAEIEGRSVIDWTVSYDIERNAREIEQIFKNGQVRDLEIDYQRPDGSIQPIEINASVFQYDSDLIVLTLCRDIAERRRIEMTLRESEERLRLILDSTDDLIILQDTEGRYLYFNSAARYGVAREDVLGLTPYDFVNRELADRLTDRLKKVVKTGQSISEETPMIWKGQGYWFSDSLFPVRDKKGTITAVVTISHNITERKRAEIALLESEATARALINAPTDSVILADPKGIILALNETAALRFGKRSDELVGVLGDDLLPEDLARSRRSLISRVLETKEMVRFEDERNGIWFDTVAYPILSETGDVIKVAIVARDITDQKNTAKQL